MLFYKNIKGLGLILIAGLSTPSFAGENLTPDRTQTTRTYKAITIDYVNLNKALKGLVMKKGVSSRTRPPTIVQPMGTRISFSNKKMTRLESNRVMFHLLKDDHKQFVHLVRQSLEALPDTVPLSSFHKNAQLAYWLNLRNITVIEALMDKYPIARLKNFWKKLEIEKRLTVAGTAMSIKDIEDLVLKNWPRAHVIYGFYNGTVGGPNIRPRAYTGKNVWRSLDRNAKEFMNSLRGIQFMGNTTKVSDFYERYPNLFPDFKNDVKKHFVANLNSPLNQRMKRTTSFKLNIHDWNIADLMNGKLGLSSASSNVPNGLALTNEGMIAGTVSSWAGDIAMDVRTGHTYPEHVQAYLRGMQKRFKMATGKVTIEEVEKKN